MITIAALLFILVVVCYAASYLIDCKRKVNPELMETLEELRESDNFFKENESLSGALEDEGMLIGSAEKASGSQEEISEPQEEVSNPQGTAASNDVQQEEEPDVPESESRVREMVNDLSLNPQPPNDQALKALLEQLMPQITADCADTYEQVKACYDYLIENCRYSTTVKYDYAYDAYLLLTEFHGSCTYYVAALHYMLLFIGVDNSIASGYRYPHPETSDKASFHRWIEISLDGTEYVLDPQWEDTLARDGEILYERFFYTHEELSSFYAF